MQYSIIGRTQDKMAIFVHIMAKYHKHNGEQNPPAWHLFSIYIRCTQHQCIHKVYNKVLLDIYLHTVRTTPTYLQDVQ